jgi:hypothetical protein
MRIHRGVFRPTPKKSSLASVYVVIAMDTAIAPNDLLYSLFSSSRP